MTAEETLPILLQKTMTSVQLPMALPLLSSSEGLQTTLKASTSKSTKCELPSEILGCKPRSSLCKQPYM